ncbi:hypothetical protein EUGRSUZ_L02367 [Eucalyptus grandis]|uniref:Coenzyme Q-binding protein COQ10 START domain-containing protein n=1 Tax=Eucalyptus grandis TaxID=71139 RepID=A0A058ZQY0_EUCGR|nr:hypothetical protein EUGRSUZ_L02367 [Eucalyptus grandis]
MPPFLSTCESVGSIVTRKNWSRHVIEPSARYQQLQNYDQTRCLGCIADRLMQTRTSRFYGAACIAVTLGYSFLHSQVIFSCYNAMPSFLRKNEQILAFAVLIRYSPVQLFDVVAAVDLCQDFVPWCQRLEILKSYPDESFDAELEIGFKFLVEGYVSHVELTRSRLVSQSTLFDHPINIWQFNSGPVPGSCSCSIYFLVGFKFQSPLYRQVASMFFREVVSRLVGSFSERCCLMYGPGVPIQEDIYGQRA